MQFEKKKHALTIIVNNWLIINEAQAALYIVVTTAVYNSNWKHSGKSKLLF